MGLMEWGALLGNVGEFVGAIAVVVTLFYLAVQVRHSREATDANTTALEESRRIALSGVYSERTKLRIDLERDILNSGLVSEIARVHSRRISGGNDGEDPLDELTGDQLQTYRRLRQMQVLMIENLLFQADQGLLDEEMLENAYRAIRRFGVEWQRLELLDTVRPSFAVTVSKVLAEEAEEARPERR